MWKIKLLLILFIIASWNAPTQANSDRPYSKSSVQVKHKVPAKFKASEFTGTIYEGGCIDIKVNKEFYVRCA